MALFSFELVFFNSKKRKILIQAIIEAICLLIRYPELAGLKDMLTVPLLNQLQHVEHNHVNRLPYDSLPLCMKKKLYIMMYAFSLE